MDADKEIFYIGILVGWLFTTLIITMVGLVLGVPEMKLVSMIYIGAGIMSGMFLISETIYFLTKFKVVRRE